MQWIECTIECAGVPEALCDELSALGLEEPFTARLSKALRDRGADIAWTCDDDQLETSVVSLVRGTEDHVAHASQEHSAQAAASS